MPVGFRGEIGGRGVLRLRRAIRKSESLCFAQDDKIN
jgi:hypothetical protein